jgi:hypothetical protein
VHEWNTNSCPWCSLCLILVRLCWATCVWIELLIVHTVLYWQVAHIKLLLSFSFVLPPKNFTIWMKNCPEITQHWYKPESEPYCCVCYSYLIYCVCVLFVRHFWITPIFITKQFQMTSKTEELMVFKYNFW